MNYRQLAALFCTLIWGVFAHAYTGVYMLLSGPSTIYPDQLLNTLPGHQSYIDGVTARVSWARLEPTPGLYDFSVFDKNLADLQTVHPTGKMNIHIYASNAPINTPQHIIDNAQETWFPQSHEYQGSGLFEQPVPWDPNAKSSWTALIKALAEHKVPDANFDGQHVPYKLHTGVGAVCVEIPGLGAIRGRNYTHPDAVPLWEHPVYTREKFLNAVYESLQAATSSFPSNQVNLSFFPYNDNLSPRLDDIITTYMAENYPRVGGFMENLQGWGPPHSPTLPIIMLNEKSNLSQPSKNWMEACDMWSSLGLCNSIPGDDDPMTAIRYAADTLHANMVQIYPADVAAFGQLLQSAHDYIQVKYPMIPLSGELTVDHEWKDFCTRSSAQDTVVLLGPPTYNGKHPGVMRMRATESADCPYQVRLQEWDYRSRDFNDWWHTNEQVSYLHLSPRVYEMDDGSIWEVGSFQHSGTGNWKWVEFKRDYADPPIVFLTMQSTNGEQAATVRAKEVGRYGFQAAIFEEEYLMDGHLQEDIGYVAIYHPDASSSDRMDGQATFNGVDYAYTLHRIWADQVWATVDGVQLKLEEEQSLDQEVVHDMEEAVDVLQVNDQVFAQQVSSWGNETTALRRQ